MTYTTPSDKIRGLKTIFIMMNNKALEALMYDNYFNYRDKTLDAHYRYGRYQKKLCLTLESLQNECNFFVEYERVFWFLFAIKQPWIIQSLLYSKTSDFFS